MKNGQQFTLLFELRSSRCSPASLSAFSSVCCSREENSGANPSSMASSIFRLILPPVVTGFILLILFGRRGPIGAFLAEHFGIVLSFRWTGAALACGVMGFPLMVRSIRLSIEAVDRKLEDAAGTLGASPLWVFATVTLPLILPGIIAGMIFRLPRQWANLVRR